MSAHGRPVVGEDRVARCPWGTTDPLLLACHDVHAA